MLNSIAIIPDGNRRYAKLHDKSLKEVYSKSVDKFQEMIDWCKEADIKTLSIWGFSTENWTRSQTEIKQLLELFEEKSENIIQTKSPEKDGVRMKVIGDVKRLPKRLQKLTKEVEEKTKNNKDLTVNLLINYGGRAEIIHAVNQIVTGKKKKISEKDFKKYLWLNEEPDLIIRTSGEMRLSGLLPFQSTYSELYFSKKYFPEFTKRDFLKAIEEFNQRKRRFGK